MTVIQDAPHELRDLACRMRPDWDGERLWAAMLAARNANWPFLRTAREVMRLVAIDDSAPDDLRIAAGETRLAAPSHHSPEEIEDLKAQALADANAATERLREQARTSEGNVA